MRTLERDTIDSLTRKLAQTADELAFWKYQGIYFYARMMFGVDVPTEGQKDIARKILEATYRDERNG